MSPFKVPSTSRADRMFEHQRLLFANMDEGFAACEMLYDDSGTPRDYRFLEVNQVFEAQTGLKSPDICGKTVLELFPDVEHTWIEKFGQVALSGASERFENFNHNTGRYFETFAYSPERSRFFLLVRDITQRKRAERSLKQNETRLRLALEVGRMAMWNSNYATGEYIWDEGIVQLLGYPPGEQASYQAWARRVHPEDLPRVEASLQASARTGGDFCAEYRVFSQNNQIRCVEARGHVESDETGKIVRSYGVMIDITDRRRAEDELRLTNERFRVALQNSPIVVFNQDLDLRYTWIYNPALGYDASAVLGKRDIDIFERGEDAAITESIKRTVIRTGLSRRQDVRIRARGVERYYDLMVDPQRDAAGSIIGVTCAAIDRTERKHAEQSISAQRRLTETVVQHIPCCVAFIRGQDLTLQLVNSCYQDLAPGRQMVGRTVRDVWPEIPALEGICLEVLKTAQPFEIVDAPMPLQPEDARPAAFYSWSIHRVELPSEGGFGLLVIGWETTARKLAEEALLRHEKLASVGRIAATIAHEVNNPLAAISNLLFLAKDAEGLPESSREYIEMADAELSRIAHITRQSLGFYRESSGPEPTRLNLLLDSAVDLMKSKISSKQASIHKHWDGEIQVTAVPGELRQVFSNLLANSLDAICPGGQVHLKVSSGWDSRHAQPCVRVTIADNGCGIPGPTHRQIFEPFFSTKGTIGTGLGLWVSKQLIEKHHGRIHMRSSTSGPRQGTAFSITLPVTRPTT